MTHTKQFEIVSPFHVCCTRENSRFNKPSLPPPPHPPNQAPIISKILSSPAPSHLQQIQNSNKTRKKMSLWTDQITIFNSHLFKYSFEYSDLELTFWIRYESRIVWTPKSGYSFSWIVQSRWQPRFSQGRARWNFPRFTTHARCSVANISIEVLGTRVNQSESRHVSDPCGWANSIWIRIRVDVEIFLIQKEKVADSKISGYVLTGPHYFSFLRGRGDLCHVALETVIFSRPKLWCFARNSPGIWLTVI